MRYLSLILVFISSLSVLGQNTTTLVNFKRTFKKAVNHALTEKELDEIFSKYSNILEPRTDFIQLKSLSEKQNAVGALNNFKEEYLYRSNIGKLLSSTNPNHRILAYIVIAATGDTSKQDVLLKRIKSNDHGHALWAGMALLYFHSDQTTALFDFLVKNEDFSDAHMLPLYIRLNKDSLQQTAYNRINSKNEKAKILAAQILSVTPLNIKTENILLEAVKSWNINIKGYAIYSIDLLQMGNLLETLKPLIDSTKTKAIVLKALANSPTSEDQNYLRTLVNEKDTIPASLLNCFYESKRVENVKFWLTLICKDKISTNYYFSVFDQPIITSDDVLPNLQKALQNIKDNKILGELPRALKGRQDDNSINILIGLLKSSDSTVRYWAASTLANNPSPKLTTTEIKLMIANGLKDGN